MKNIIVALVIGVVLSTDVHAQFKKDGTLDMRFSQNKQIYSNPYPSTNTIYSTNSNVRYQNGYIKNNGTFVDPHYKTDNNNSNWDNFSTKENYNPYTGNSGSRARDYSSDALNYGSGRQIQTGARGGQYYINSNGNKTYVPKRGGGN
jgi:hypothetical protein